MDKITYITKRLAYTVQNAKDNLAGFAARLQDDPVYAFQWADRYMTDAANAQVADRVLKTLTSYIDKEGELPEDAIAATKSYVMDQIIHYAGNVSNSTSPCSNAMDGHLRKAWVLAHEILNQ